MTKRLFRAAENAENQARPDENFFAAVDISVAILTYFCTRPEYIYPIRIRSILCMRRICFQFSRISALFLVFFLVSSLLNLSIAADGEALFKANCANCHKPLEDYTGPA